MTNKTLLVILLFVLALVVGFLLGATYTSQRADDAPDDTTANTPLTALFASTNTLSETIHIRAGDNLQAIVEQAPSPSIFVIGTGIHRVQNITPRDNDHFIGEEGAILNGSIVLEGFTLQDDGRWMLDDPVLNNYEPNIGGVCREGFERCNHPYQLYINDQPLNHVTNADLVTVDSWYFDYDVDRIYMGQNPDGQTVELSTAFHAFDGEANGVIIENLTIEKYGGFGQLGAIRAQDASDWIIRNNTIQLNAGAGITFGGQMQILNNRILRNGQIGISGQGADVVIAGNEIAYNNYAQYDPAWEAGGTKFVATDNLIVRDNYVHHNDGPGLWTDIGNYNTRYEYNLVIANNGSGILHEISYDAVIRHNVVRYNRNQPTSVYFGAQITLSSSGNVQVYDNDIVSGANGGNGIVIIQQDRGEGRRGVYQARNNSVYDNRMVFLSDAGQSGAATDVPDVDWFWQENNFNNNQYYGLNTDDNLWGWRNVNLNWSDFEAQITDAGTYTADIPLDALSSPAWRSVRALADAQ